MKEERLMCLCACGGGGREGSGGQQGNDGGEGEGGEIGGNWTVVQRTSNSIPCHLLLSLSAVVSLRLSLYFSIFLSLFLLASNFSIYLALSTYLLSPSPLFLCRSLSLSSLLFIYPSIYPSAFLCTI